MIVGKEVEDINVKVPEDAYDTGKYMPTFSAYIIAIVRDSMGRVINVHRQKSHSPTANFMGLFLPLNWYGSSSNSFTLTNATGGTCTYTPSLGQFTYNITYPSVDGHPTYLIGIQVGSGQQTNTFNAHNLADPIANGSGVGQLVYGSPSVSTGVSVSGSSAYIYIMQTFANQSGGAISVTELGIMVAVQTGEASIGYTANCGNLLVWYDVLSSAISVPNGGSLTIAYTFTVNP
jgi:hypothetical protein